MPFKLSFPDLARRLARGLGILGKTPVQLDETAVSTVLIRDLTLPEFARIPVEWASHGVVLQVAVNFSVVGIRCESGVLVVNQMRVRNLQAGFSQARLNRAVVGTPSGFFASRTLFVLNRPGEEQLVTPSSALGAVTAGAVPGVIIYETRDTDPEGLRLDTVLFPGDELVFTSTATNEGIEAWFTGKQYPDLR